MKLVRSSMPRSSTIILATRGSALALAQAEIVLKECRAAFPDLRFEVKVIRTSDAPTRSVDRDRDPFSFQIKRGGKSRDTGADNRN